MSKSHKIKKIDVDTISLYDPIWSGIQAEYLDNSNFSPDIECPETSVKIVYSDSGMTVKFECCEKNPVARYKNLNDPACLDSCVEFFFSPFAGMPGEYMNFELGAAGALLIQTGDKNNRQYVGEDIGVFKTETQILSDKWLAKIFIPFEFVNKYFPYFDKCFRGNFQFCNGDKGIFITWNKIDTEKLAFHVPEFFAELILD